MYVELVTETFPPEVNGVARTLEKLVSGLVERGHRVGVVRPRQRGETAAPRLEAEPMLVPGAPLPGYGRLRFGVFSGGRLRRRWRGRRPDVVHVATEGPLGLSAIRTARREGIPVCSSFHTNFHTYGKFYGYGFLIHQALVYLRWVHNLTGRTLVPGPDTLQTLASEGFRNLAILGRGVDTELFSPSRRSDGLRCRWAAQEQAPVVLYVGRLAAEKNIRLAIRSFVALEKRRPGSRFVLVGDGPEEEWLRLRYPQIEFCGLQRGESLAAHYASGDLLLFPSLTETFGNVLLEGMASGLAVIGFDYAAAAQHVRQWQNGVKVTFGESREFVERTIELGSDPGRWRELGRAARRTAESNRWTAIVEQFEQHLDSVRNGSRPPLAAQLPVDEPGTPPRTTS